MLLYYAVGGGLGHITRALAVQHTLCLGSMVVMTAQTAIQQPAFTDRIQPLLVPPKLAADKPVYLRWLQQQLELWQPEQIILDTFPVGILGEWSDISLAAIQVNHVARYIKWPAYARYAGCREWPEFSITWQVESLHPQQQIALCEHSSCVQSLRLEDPCIVPLRAERRMIEGVKNTDFWLVVHSGAQDEILALVDYAEQHCRQIKCNLPIFIVTSTALPKRFAARVLALYPASPLFDVAERIYSGGGFNVMRQLQHYAAKHYPMPFDRTFDDQYHRVAEWRNQQPLRKTDVSLDS